MRTNIQLSKWVANKKPNTLFNHVFTRGDIVIYQEYDKQGHCSDHRGVYLDHTTYATWHNGVAYYNNHRIHIIKEDGTQGSTDWIKPITK
jgi:hypothetical protein